MHFEGTEDSDAVSTLCHKIKLPTALKRRDRSKQCHVCSSLKLCLVSCFILQV